MEKKRDPGPELWDTTAFQGQQGEKIFAKETTKEQLKEDKEIPRCVVPWKISEESISRRKEQSAVHATEQSGYMRSDISFDDGQAIAVFCSL